MVYFNSKIHIRQSQGKHSRQALEAQTNGETGLGVFLSLDYSALSYIVYIHIPCDSSTHHEPILVISMITEENVPQTCSHACRMESMAQLSSYLCLPSNV